MCGIVGFTTPRGLAPEERECRFGDRLRRMTASQRHRGPDCQRGLLLDGVALGHARLSIVDLEGGTQPMRDAASGVTLVFNGEIFNYVELREELAAGHRFRTASDTEVILAAYLAKGIDCVTDFNGQFAFAIYDPRTRTLWLARDRVGIVPLHYTQTREGLAFSSEAKALFAGGWLAPAFDAIGLKQTVQLWAPVSSRTLFEGISQLEAGTVASWSDGRLRTRRYWDLALDVAPRDDVSEDAALDELGTLLDDAIRLRLRADVPVAAYLSGGIDSSLLCGMAQRQLGGTLATFSVGFDDPRFDERSFQSEVAACLSTRHRSALVTEREIGEMLPAVVRQTEQVLLRSAPAPLYKLSELVRASNTKVVLTGEGADEIFFGYDLYRETQIRQFWARDVRSAVRPALLAKVYPYFGMSKQSAELFRQFFAVGLDEPAALGFSHLPRWLSSGRIFRFFSTSFAERAAAEDPVATLLGTVPPGFGGWRPLARAQYLEMKTLLSGYLLSAQGDRMLMGHSIEGRYPFLDHRLIEFAASLPVRLKLRGLREKWLLKRFAEPWVPRSVLARTKYPYRAPVAAAVAGPLAAPWSRIHLSREAVRAVGVFDEEKVDRLVAKLAAPEKAVSESDGQAITAIATTQLLAAELLRPVEIPRCDRDAVLLDAA